MIPLLVGTLIALLASIPGDRLADLASRMKRENVQPGKTVVIEGEPGERFYVVLSGRVAIIEGPARTVEGFAALVAMSRR